MRNNMKKHFQVLFLLEVCTLVPIRIIISRGNMGSDPPKIFISYFNMLYFSLILEN